MVQFFRRWLANTAVRDPIMRRQAPLLQLLILGLLSTVVFRMVFFLAQDLRSFGAVGLVSNLVAASFCIIGVVLLRKGDYNGAVTTVAAGFLVALTTVLIPAGVNNSGVLSLAFAIPVTLVGLLASRRALIFISSVSVGIVACLLLLEAAKTGVTPTNENYSVAQEIFTFTLIVAIIAFLVSRFGQEFRTALAASTQQERLLQHEINERIRAEAALRESEEQYRLITENACDLISLFDDDGSWIYASPSYREILNYAPVELIGRKALQFIHPNDRQHVIDNLGALGEGENRHGSFRIRHASSTWRWVEGTWTRVARHGESLTIAAWRDITERKLLEQQLAQAQRMESIGRLAGGIAHDFNNLLTAVIGSSELALHSLPSDSPAREDLTTIADVAKRSANLTRQLLAFARKQPIEPYVLDVNSLINDMVQLLKRLLGADIDLILTTDADVWTIRADPGQIEQVLVNMVVNACDAMPNGGKLTIETHNVTLDNEDVRQHLYIKPGQYVMIAISDTGIGIEPHIQDQIFEPFFTTKEPGKGTGLGLATCYGIIKQHGGDLWVYSEPNNGTCFKIYLPSVLAPIENAAPVIEISMPATGTETILLVENDSFVRSLAARVLTEYGYTVYVASCPREALEIIAQPLVGPVQLLVSDLVLPEMNGRAISEKVLHVFPAAKVLFVSGYADSAIAHHGHIDADVAFLSKPFSPVALVRKVREVLDA